MPRTSYSVLSCCSRIQHSCVYSHGSEYRPFISKATKLKEYGNAFRKETIGENSGEQGETRQPITVDLSCRPMETLAGRGLTNMIGV